MSALTLFGHLLGYDQVGSVFNGHSHKTRYTHIFFWRASEGQQVID
jgi:hypothetical protein